MKKILYVLNDCMRKFSYERTAGLYRALQKTGEPFNLYVLRSDAYSGFYPEHNYGEYNIYRLPDYGDFDAILLDINSVFDAKSNEYSAMGIQYIVRAAAASGKPVISMANHIPGFYYVGIDNHSASTSVIEHLHRNHGLSDFWFALGPADNYENQARTRGLLDYCALNGLPCGEDRVFAESFIIECGIHAFNTLLARHDGHLPQAIICANDHIAMGICHAARAAGFCVPDDFLVTGFDNTDLSATFSPPITSVDQECWTMGDTCVDVLRRIWKGEAVPEIINTPTRLVLRQSTERAAVAPEPVQKMTDYIGNSSSSTDFNYKMSAMQYKLPACKSIEEICRALIDCICVLNCDGIDLILDSRLFDQDRMLSFRDHTGQLRDITNGLCVEGYPNTLELVCMWEKGSEPVFTRKRIGNKLSTLALKGSCANYLFAPLHFMEHTAGFLCVRNCLDLMRIKGVSVIVSTLTMALRTYFSAQSLTYINHVLSGISMKDGLTGLYNRLSYHELALPLYREMAGGGGKLLILFLDMDRLKHINDVYGHAEGDRAIRCVAAAIQENLPQNAIPVRYGGDEFLVLIPNVDGEAVPLLLDSIETALPALAEAQGLPEVPGISSGFVLADPSCGRSLDEYVHEADERMYREKKAKKVQRPG